MKSTIKTLFVLTLILCLLLCGCTPSPSADSGPSDPSTAPSTEPSKPTEPPVKPTEPPVDPTEPPVDPTEPPASSFGNIVPLTDGALRALPLDMGVYCDAHLWGDTVLLYNDRKCQVRSLEDGSVLHSGPGVGANAVTVTEDYIIYYVLSTQKIVFRDKSLETVKTVDVNVSVDVSEMLFTQDGSKAYYHIYPSNAIVELDILTGEERVIPVDGAPIWSLSGFAFNTLYYWGKEDGQDYDAFVELSSGKYLGKDTQITKLQTWDNGYYLCRTEDGNAKHLIVIESTERYIELQEYENLHYSTWALPQVNSLFALHCDYESPTVILELYDLTTEECTNSLTVDLGQPYQNATDVFVDPSGEYIWLCMKVGNTGDYQMVLYRWDFQANATVE